MTISEKKIVDRYHIYVGLGDKDTHEQEYDTQKYVNAVDYICRGNDVTYTLNICRGGYAFESGVYVNEVSLDIMLLGAGEDMVKALASDLCAIFNQHSVLITHDMTEIFDIEEESIY